MALQYFSHYKGFLILTGRSTDISYDYSIREYSSSIVLRTSVKATAKHMHKYIRILFDKLEHVARKQRNILIQIWT